MSLTANLEEEELMDALGNDGNASMPEQVNWPNPRRRRRRWTKKEEENNNNNNNNLFFVS